MWKEFKEFAFKGSVFDLAIAFVLGVAFAAVINSLVKDIIMPLVSLVTGGLDFNNWFVSLNGKSYATLADAQKAGAATLNFGVFINVVITFLIVALVLFLLVRAYNRARRAEAEEVTTKACPFCKTDIPLEATRCPACTSELTTEIPLQETLAPASA